MPDQKDTRRHFVRNVIASSAGVTLGSSLANGKEEPGSESKLKIHPEEWRNRQSDMSYRRFGNTGLMVSEIVFGTTPWKSDRYLKIIEAGLEKGINYIDTAPAYSKGEAERIIGRFIKQSGKRDQFFLSNKISFYDEYMRRLSLEMLKDLPAEKQSELDKKADQMIEERGVLKPGYHFKYFGGQDRKFKVVYLRHLVIKEYGSLRKWKTQIQSHSKQLVENSLNATQTDYFDVLHCPHGTAMPEELEDENIREVLEDLKTEGKIRFSATSMHNDVPAILEKAIELGYYDAAMFAYNIANHAALDIPVRKAKEAGMGLVAMKVARIVSNPGMGDVPQWRIDKLNAAIGEERSLQSKAYLWALQNPNLSCCVSEMPTPEAVADNASVTGRKVEIGLV
ncbi:MAG: aldo/keto reductase [Verrucomicrobiota bacterium]